MESRIARIIVISSAVAAGMMAALLLFAPGAFAQGPGQPVVELRSNSSSDRTRAGLFDGQKIAGTDSISRQGYKFQRERQGKYFSYTVANLQPSVSYYVELSFVEHDQSAAGRRIFNVYLNGVLSISKLDVYARAGKNKAYQQTRFATTDSGGFLSMTFRSDQAGCRDYATISTIRIYKGSSSNVVEIDAAASRLSMNVPTRFSNDTGQDSYETVLGRLGSRFCLNLLPQKLSARSSSLGDGTGDLSDLVLALADANKTKVRALPFTDRFPVWGKMTFSQTMTSQTYSCSDAAMPGMQLTVAFRSPFYPGEEQLSEAPFFYVDVTVRNSGATPASPSFVFARPQKQSFAESSISTFNDSTKTGYQGSTNYSYYDETYTAANLRRATEALSVQKSDPADVTFRGTSESDFTDFTADSLWGYASPAGYPRTYSDYKNPVFSFYPRGYTGAVWTPTLAAGQQQTKHFIMAGYVQGRILNVKNSSYNDGTFHFKYTNAFPDVQGVLDYAETDRDDADKKSNFFDSTVSSDTFLSLPSGYGANVKNLMAYSFQSFLINTWWARSEASREWFSVWEGSSCRFHSTIDVEYNDAWFYLDYWPDLLKKTMDEWVLYQKTAQQGTYLSHDMGFQDMVTGQAYPGNMAVEENADFILLLYKYWKTTGEKGYMGQQFPLVRKLVDFIANCDSNHNGIPDQYVTNTVDQGSLAIQNGKDQSYLGTKCLAAYQAAREMALSLPSPDLSHAAKCKAQVESINQTLTYDMWLSDHFAVCVDDDVLAADREAYSIYPSNGLLYLLSGTRAAGLTSTNTARMRADLVNSTARTLKSFGCTHSSYDAYNQWVSQNIWRDQVACHLGASLNGDDPLAMSNRYWNLERYYAKSLWGSWWDVVVYPGGAAGGASASRGGTASRGGSGRSEGAGGAGRAGSGSDGGASSFQQSLGYYPRGAVSLGLPDAEAGLVLDYPDKNNLLSGKLYYRQTTGPLRVPVLSRADWGNPSESLRVPTLYFADASSPAVPTNAGLLPALAPLKLVDMTAVSAGDHALSPNSDGVNDSATISYSLPRSARVTASIWEGSNLIKSYPASVKGAGPQSFTWDGRTDGGRTVGDGVYTASIDAVATDTSFEIRPASTPVFVNNTISGLATTWYLAEGFTGRNATGGDFEEYVLIQNPEAQPANVQVTFMMPGGRTEERSYVVPAASRFTISVDDLLPDAEVSTYIKSDRPVAAERAMYFNGRKAGHDSIGVSRPSKTWYLAEGYTAGTFDEYVLIQNPGSRDARVTADFMTASTGNETRQYTVGPHSRFTIHVDDIVPADSVSTEVTSSEPVVVERAQYLNDMTAGTASIGAVSTSRTWYLAEGYTDSGFETWVLLQNPQNTYNNVTVTFMERDGSSTVRQYRLAPQSRFSILVDAYLPASEVSTRVRSEDPVIVERAMYWNDRSDGHDSIGTPTPDSEWYLAEGYTGGGFETWVLVQNPGDDTRNVTMTFMEPGGKNTVRTYQVAPRSRFTVDVNGVLPEAEVSTRVSADGPIIVERAMYFNGRSGGTDSIGIR